MSGKIEKKIEILPHLHVVIEHTGDSRIVWIEGKWSWWKRAFGWLMWHTGCRDVMCEVGADVVAPKLLFQLPTDKEVVFVGGGVLDGSTALGLSKRVDKSVGVFVGGSDSNIKMMEWKYDSRE
jgi:hypothetical protein